MNSRALKISLYVIGLLFILAVGILMILRMGYTPQPVGIMKPSFFHSAEEIGAAVYRRFYVPIDERKLIVFGIPPQPEFHRTIVRGFLEAASVERRPFEVLVTEVDMPVIDLTGIPTPQIKPIRINTESQAEWIDAVNEARASGKRTLFYLPSVFSTHLLPENAIRRFEKKTGQRLFTITSGPLSLRPDQEYIVDPVCIGSQVDGQGTAPLGCAILQSGRSVYRKKVPQDRWVAMMNDQGIEDYLLMVSTPGQNEASPPQPTPPAKPPSI